MKKLFGLFLLLVLIAGIAAAQGTGPGKGKMTLGPALNLELPIGNYGDIAGFGIGATGRFQYGLENNIALTGDLGWIWHAKKNEISTTVVPLLVGGKYGFAKNWFASAQLGLLFITTSVDLAVPEVGFAIDASGSTTSFAFAPGIGYEHGPWEGLFRFVVLETDVMNLGLTVAYNFPLN